MKKVFGVLFLTVFCVTALCACLSNAEREKADANIAKAKPIVEKYVSENYSGAEIENVTFLEHNKTDGYAVLDFSVYASDYCKADIKYNGSEFQVIVNVETNACYDNRLYKDIASGINEYLKSLTKGFYVSKTENRIFDKTLVDELYTKDCVGFFDKSVTEYKDVLGSENYSVFSLFICDSSFQKADYNGLTEDNGFKCDMYVGFIKPKANRNMSFPDGLLEVKDENTDYIKLSIEERTEYMNIEEKMTFKTYSDGILKMDNDCLYKTEEYGSFVFVWDSKRAHFEFSEKNAPDTVSTKKYYSGEEFYSIYNKAAVIDYEMKDNRRDDFNVYILTPYKEGDLYLVSMYRDSTVKDIDKLTSTYNSSKNRKYYIERVTFDGSRGREIMIGIYKKGTTTK